MRVPVSVHRLRSRISSGAEKPLLSPDCPVRLLKAYEAVTLWAFANKIIPYVSFRVHPVYCILVMATVPFLQGFKKISNIPFFGFLPIQFFYLLVLFITLNIFFTRGSIGRIPKDIGFNHVTFFESNTKRYLLLIYTLAGFISGIASIIYLGAFHPLQPAWETA